MKSSFNKSIFTGLLIFALFPLHSVKAQRWEMGAALGASGYMGEFNPNKPYLFNGFSGSIGVKHNWNGSWGLRLEAGFTQINGSSRHYIQPGTLILNTEEKIFPSKSLIEVSLLPEFNFFNFQPTTRKSAYTPYVIAGVGMRLDAGPDSPKQRLLPPFGAGFKYNLKSGFSLDARLLYRITGDRFIDTGYPATERGEFANRLTQLADDGTRKTVKSSFINRMNTTDSYMTFQFGVTYTLFKHGCPTW